MARFKNRDGQGGSDDYFHLIRVNPCFTCTFEDMKEAQSSSNESCHDICAPIRCAVAVSTLRSRDRLTTNNVWRVVNLSSNNTFFFSLPSSPSPLSLYLFLVINVSMLTCGITPFVRNNITIRFLVKIKRPERENGLKIIVERFSRINYAVVIS